jgi:hypothetical protein
MAAITVKTLFKKYLKDLSEVALRGDAREKERGAAIRFG